MTAQELFAKNFPTLTKHGLVKFPSPTHHTSVSRMRARIWDVTKRGLTHHAYYSPDMAKKLSTKSA